MTGDVPKAFPLKAQYLKSMREAREAAGGGHSDDEMSSAGESEKVKHVKKPQSKNPPQKKNRKSDSKVSQKRGADEGPAWNYNQVRMEFIKDVRAKLHCSFSSAKSLWDSSAKKKALLATLSLQELKRRKFVDKSCACHPWA